MRKPSLDTIRFTTKPGFGEEGNVRILVLLLGVFLLGIAVSALWYQRAAREDATGVDRATPGRMALGLSDHTKTVLRGLSAPVEIRFYSLLGQGGEFGSLRAFAGRVDHLLSEYQREAGGKIKVTRHNAQSQAARAAALGDGLTGFSVEQGETCYLGLTVAQQDRKESLPQLAPEWEQALESDLTRAIARVSRARSSAAQVATASPADPVTAEEVKRLIPNPASVSVEKGVQILREAALKEFKAAATEMQRQIQLAQQRLSQAQSGQSEAEQQTAMTQLQQTQMEQTEKLKAVATRLQAQIAAWESLKRQ